MRLIFKFVFVLVALVVQGCASNGALLLKNFSIPDSVSENERCFEATLRVDGDFNILTMCLTEKDKGTLGMFFMNQTIESTPTSCHSKAKHNFTGDNIRFKFISELGKCDNSRDFASFELSCKKREANLITCNEHDLGMRLHFTRPG